MHRQGPVAMPSAALLPATWVGLADREVRRSEDHRGRAPGSPWEGMTPGSQFVWF